MQTANRPTPRAQARARLEADIVQLGRKHLARHGAAALSLRAIARELGMVSSAVYRYVRNRDELLTLLVVDAYDELADHVDTALDHDGRDEAAVGARIGVIGHAIRSWASAEPARFALIYGSPVPGYRAPAEQTTGPGTRVIARMLAELSGTAATLPSSATVPLTLSREFAAIGDQFGIDIDEPTLVVGFCLWSTILGAVSLEVFGQYGTDTFSAPGDLFDLQLRSVCERLLPG